MITEIAIIRNDIRDLESRVRDLEGIKNPLTVEDRISHLYDMIDNITTSMANLMQKLNAINTDDKYIEVFDDKDLKGFYEVSGLMIKDVRDYIGKNITRAEITNVMAYNYVNGEVKDLKARSILGKYLRQHATNNKVEIA